MSNLESQDPHREISRRQLFGLGFRYAVVAVLAERGAFALAGAPITRFFLSPEYISPHAAHFLRLTTEEMNNTQAFGIGTSYVNGQDATSPVVIISDSVTNAGLATWTFVVEAKSGSYLDAIPSQIASARKKQIPGKYPVVTTDSGYNSLTKNLLANADIVNTLMQLLHESVNFKALAFPDTIKKLNELCEAFFIALDATHIQLLEALGRIISDLGTNKVHVYKYPPLELVSHIVHIPQREDPDDKYFSVPIAGNWLAEAFARRISILGSSDAERVIEIVSQSYEGAEIVPIDLRKVLAPADYRGKPNEHPLLRDMKQLPLNSLPK